MHYILGFIIAMFIALTGVGAGTITTPLLILFLHVPTAIAVTTGLVFSAAVKLLLVPTQVMRRQVHWKALGMMLLGGVPGVIIGSLFLSSLVSKGSQHLMNVLLGLVLVSTAAYQIVFSFRPMKNPRTIVRDCTWCMSLLMLPVGAEVGFSSAGAGALGTAALLSLTNLEPAQVVGTDILFGFVISVVGSSAHLLGHAADPVLLKHLVIGGVFGVITGVVCAKLIPKRPLRFALWVWLLIIGVQFLCAKQAGH